MKAANKIVIFHLSQNSMNLFKVCGDKPPIESNGINIFAEEDERRQKLTYLRIESPKFPPGKP